MIKLSALLPKLLALGPFSSLYKATLPASRKYAKMVLRMKIGINIKPIYAPKTFEKCLMGEFTLISPGCTLFDFSDFAAFWKTEPSPLLFFFFFFKRL